MNETFKSETEATGEGSGIPLERAARMPYDPGDAEDIARCAEEAIDNHRRNGQLYYRGVAAQRFREELGNRIWNW